MPGTPEAMLKDVCCDESNLLMGKVQCGGGDGMGLFVVVVVEDLSKVESINFNGNVVWCSGGELSE